MADQNPAQQQALDNYHRHRSIARQNDLVADHYFNQYLAHSEQGTAPGPQPEPDPSRNHSITLRDGTVFTWEVRTLDDELAIQGLASP